MYFCYILNNVNNTTKVHIMTTINNNNRKITTMDNKRQEALSVQQVADELNYVNKRTVIANIKAGLITGYKQPGRNGKYFVYREDLEEYKDSLKVNVTDMAIA